MPNKLDPQGDEAALHHGRPQPAAKGAAASPAETLTPRQQRILTFIRETVRVKGYPPSIREVGEAVGLRSTSSAAFQMKQLEKKGFIAADPGIPRGYRILSQGSQAPVTPSQRPGGCPLLACDSVDGRTDPLVLKIVLDPATRRDLLSGALLTVRHLSPSETGSTDCGGAAVLGQVTAIAQPMGNHRP